MKGRPYAKKDMSRMQEALAIVTAYDMGTGPNDFKEYVTLVNESGAKTKDSLAQLAWLFLRSAEEASGVPKEHILAWYGQKFANSQWE